MSVHRSSDPPVRCPASRPPGPYSAASSRAFTTWVKRRHIRRTPRAFLFIPRSGPDDAPCLDRKEPRGSPGAGAPPAGQGLRDEAGRRGYAPCPARDAARTARPEPRQPTEPPDARSAARQSPKHRVGERLHTSGRPDAGQRDGCRLGMRRLHVSPRRGDAVTADYQRLRWPVG